MIPAVFVWSRQQVGDLHNRIRSGDRGNGVVGVQCQLKAVGGAPIGADGRVPEHQETEADVGNVADAGVRHAAR